MAGWQDVLEIIGMLVVIFVVGGWLAPKIGIFYS